MKTYYQKQKEHLTNRIKSEEHAQRKLKKEKRALKLALKHISEPKRGFLIGAINGLHINIMDAKRDLSSLYAMHNEMTGKEGNHGDFNLCTPRLPIQGFCLYYYEDKLRIDEISYEEETFYRRKDNDSFIIQKEDCIYFETHFAAQKKHNEIVESLEEESGQLRLLREEENSLDKAAEKDLCDLRDSEQAEIEKIKKAYKSRRLELTEKADYFLKRKEIESKKIETTLSIRRKTLDLLGGAK